MKPETLEHAADACGTATVECIDETLKEMFPDWHSIPKGEWSQYGKIIQAAGTNKIEIGLYREDDSDPEIAGTLTLQVFVNDDVMVCEQVSTAVQPLDPDTISKRVLSHLKKHHGEMIKDNEPQIEIFADPGDAMSDKDAIDILTSSDPEAAFTEYLMETYREHEDSEIDSLSAEILKEEFHGGPVSEETIRDCLRENIGVCYQEDHYLRQEFQVTIMLDTGDVNSDFTLNDLYACKDSDRFPEHSSLLWLVKQQGHTEEEVRAEMSKKFDPDNVTFLSSVDQELLNAPERRELVTFLVRMPMRYLLRLNTAMRKAFQDGKMIYDAGKRPGCGTLTLSSNTVCGLYNPWSGGGSLLEIELEKDVEIPIKYLWSCLPDSKHGFGNYDVQSTYDLSSKMWSYGEVVQIHEGGDEA